MASRIGDLPQEVLCMIFGQLPHSDYSSLRLVNATWDAILRVPVLQDLSVSPDTISSILSAMERSLAGSNDNVPMGYLVKNVYTQCSEGLSGSDLNHLARLCPNITTFYVDHHLLKTLDLDDDAYDTYDFGDCDQEPDTTHLASFFAALGSSLTTLVLHKAFPSSFVYKVALPPLVNLVELDFKHWGVRTLDPSLMGRAVMDFDDLMDFIQDSCPQLRSLAISRRSLAMKEALLDIKKLKRRSIFEIQAALSTWSDSIRPWSGLTSLNLDISLENEPRQREWETAMLLYLAVKLTELQHFGLNLRCSTLSSTPGGVLVMNLHPTAGDRHLCVALLSTIGNDLYRQYVFLTLRSVTLNNIPLHHTTNLILFSHDSALRLSTPPSTLQPTPGPPPLKKLEISDCFGAFRRLECNKRFQSDFFQQRIFDRSLASLTLDDIALNFPDMLHHIDPATNLITHLNLQVCHSDYGSVPLDRVLDRFPRLKQLHLSVLSLGQHSLTLDNEAPPHPLEKLCLNQTTITSTELFGLLSDRCRHLTDLSLTNLTIVKSPRPPLEYDEVPRALFGEVQGCPLTRKSATWISMPATCLSSLALGPHMGRYGHRYRYRHASHLILPYSPDVSPSLYFVKEHTGGEPQMERCGAELTNKILDCLASPHQTTPSLGPEGEHCYNLIKKHGMVIFHCKKIKDLRFE